MCFFSCPFLENCKPEEAFLLNFWNDTSHPTASQHVGCNRHVSSCTVQNCYDRMMYFNVSLGKSEKDSSLQSKPSRILKGVPFRHCCLFFEGVGGNITIKMFANIEYSCSCNFLPILYLFLDIFSHSRLCNTLYIWSYHLAVRRKKKKNHSPLTNSCCICRYWMHKSINCSGSGAQET